MRNNFNEHPVNKIMFLVRTITSMGCKNFDSDAHVINIMAHHPTSELLSSQSSSLLTPSPSSSQIPIFIVEELGLFGNSDEK